MVPWVSSSYPPIWSELWSTVYTDSDLLDSPHPIKMAAEGMSLFDATYIDSFRLDGLFPQAIAI